jgi:hypothetical protein
MQAAYLRLARQVGREASAARAATCQRVLHHALEALDEAHPPAVPAAIAAAVLAHRQCAALGHSAIVVPAATARQDWVHASERSSPLITALTALRPAFGPRVGCLPPLLPSYHFAGVSGPRATSASA